MAGIAAGLNTVPNAGVPTNGVAKNGSIFAVQVFTRFNLDADCGGAGTAPCVRTWDSDQVLGLDHVFANLNLTGGVKVASVNMSLGSGSNASTCDGASQKPAIDNLRAAGVLTAIASGNNGFTSTIGSPGCISTAVTVGSTTKTDVISSFSNMSSVVDVMAPGGVGGGTCAFGANNNDILGPVAISPPATNGYFCLAGTSMATPHVAGAIAAIRSACPSVTADAIEAALKSTGLSITDTRPGGTQTKPRVRVDLAVQQACAATLSVSPTTVAAGGGVTATWSGIPSPASKDWIGLFASSGAPNTSFLAWIYVSCSPTPGAAAAAGACNFTIPNGTPAGTTYELRLFANDSYTRLATSNSFTVTVVATLSASPTTRKAGSSLTATWSGMPSPTSADWIGLYASSGAPNTSFLAWIYVSCSQTAGAAAASGSCAFPIPNGTPAGTTYQLRLFANNGYTRRATSNTFTVTAGGGPVLNVSPTNVAAGTSVVATWSGIAIPTATDWIGLYVPGAANTAYLAWVYVSCTHTPGPVAAQGGCWFMIPGGLAAGTYELRLLSNNSYTLLATSNPLSVH